MEMVGERESEIRRGGEREEDMLVAVLPEIGTKFMS